MKPERRVDLSWQNEEVRVYERIASQALSKNKSIQAYIKDALSEDG